MSKDLERVADAIATAYQERSELQRQAWDSFEAVVARNVHVHPKKGANSVNVFASGSPFRYLTKRETIEEFRQQTEALMQQDKTLTREAAEKQVMARHRASLAEQAQARTLESSVVPGVSAQDWAAHGGASYHYTLPAAKAYQAVDRSNGFLYAKPAGNGLCELRPTLPETVEIRGNTIPLRRSYTLMIKAILHLLLDEQGNLREHAEDLAYRISELRDPSVSEALLNTELRPHLITILGGDESHADETIGHLTTLMQASSNESFPPREIMYGLAGDMQRMNIPALMESKVRRMQEIDQKMQAEGHSTEEIQRALDAFSASFRSLFADLDQAHRELMTIRNMDPNSLEVPLPNACSAHANFINGIREGCMGAEAAQAHTLSFETASHIMAHPLVHIDHCLAHLDSIAWPIVHSTREETVPRLQALRAEIQAAQQQGQPYQLSDADRNLLCILVIKASKVPAKYEYHMAANLGKTDDGLQITSEGFAAETKQYMVSPFSLHHAVGLYRGNEEKHAITGAYSNTGMVTYYCRDNPLPSDADAALLAAKLSLRGEDGGVNA